MFRSRLGFTAIPHGNATPEHHRILPRLGTWRAHWKAPRVMVTALLCGIASACGHHMFYHSLDGKKVQSDKDAISIAWYSVSQQRFNTTIGTACAFFVKSCLMLAVTTTYVQVFWRTIKEIRRTTRVSTINILSSATANPLSLLHLSVWARYPLLFTLAVTPW